MINEENGLPIPPKKESTGLPIPPLKKKVATEPTQSTEQLPSNAPLVSEGGSSGLETGGLEQSKSNTANSIVDNSNLKGVDFESARTYKKPIKTELGGSAYAYTKPNKDFTIEDDRNNNKILKDAANKTQIEDYDKYKVKKSTEQQLVGKKPFAQDDTQNTIDYYFDHLKRNDPEQYNYVISRQKSLSEDKLAHLEEGDTEDVQEDDLMLQKVNADLIREAFKLKANVFASKKEQASNLIKNNYSDILSKVNDGSKRNDDISSRVSQIESTITEMYSDDEGRIMMTPYNKDDIQNLFKERDSLLEEKNNLEKEMGSLIADEKFTSAMSILDDVEKSYNAIAETYNKINANDPSVFKGFDEYKKQVKKTKDAQKIKDFTEEMTGGDFGISEAIGRSISKLPKTLAYITKGSDENYGLNDWAYDVVASNVEDFDNENNPLPTGFNEEVYKDGKWNMRYLPGKLAGTIADMAPAIGVTMLTEGATAGLLAKLGTSGELGTYMGSFAGEYITQVSDLHDEATKAGVSNKDAVTWARGMATTQSLIGAISPDINLARFAKGGLDEVVMAIAKKQSPIDAIKKTLGKIANNAIKEVPTEIAQTLQEISDKNKMYRDTGVSEKIVDDVKSAVVETTVISLMTSVIMGGSSFRSSSQTNKQALFMAANQPDVVMKRAMEMLKNREMSQEKFDKFEAVMQKASVAVSKLSKDLDAEKKVEIIPIIMEKEDLKEEKTNTDESQHEAINEKIKQKDEEIKSVLEAPSEEQVEYENLVNDFLSDFDKSQSEDAEQEIEQPQENATEQVISEIQEEKDGIKLDESLTDTQKSEKEMELSQAELELKQNEQVELTEQKPVNKEGVVPLNDKASKDEAVDNVEEKPSENKTEETNNQDNVSEKQELTQDYIDKQEQLEESVSNDKDIEAKMENDIKVLQSFSITNEKYKGKTQQEIEKLATTKYQGAITRAYKAFLDKKIKRSTYTDFRNRLEEVLGPKVAEKGRDTNGKIDAIRDKVKEILLGEGYKQKQLYAFTSAVPLTPKNVEQLIDLTFDIIKKGVAAGKEIKSFTKFVLNNASKIKNYSAILEAEGFTDEDFRNAFNKRINEFDKSEKYEAKAESDKKESVDTEKQNNENQQSNEDGTSQSNKETVDTGSNEQNKETESTSQSNKKEETKKKYSDVESGEKGDRRHIIRLELNKKFEGIIEGNFLIKQYNKLKKRVELKEYLKDIVKSFSDEDVVIVVNDMINNDSPFDPVLDESATRLLIERMEKIKEKSESIAVQAKMDMLSTNLLAVSAPKLSLVAKILSTSQLLNDEMAVSVQSIKKIVNAHISKIQDENISASEKESISNAYSDINEILQTDEFKDIIKQRLEEERLSISKQKNGDGITNKILTLKNLLDKTIENC